MAALIYRPWEGVPFDVTDFSEILPLLQDSSGSFERLGSVVGYYFDHGRINVLTSVLIWVQWEIFGPHAPAWRLFRIVVFGALIWTFVRAATQFQAPLAAGVLGATLFVIGGPATEGWLRLTGEPLATIFLLCAITSASRYQDGQRPIRSALVLAAFCVAMVLTKEIMIVCLPLVLILAATWSDGAFRAPRLDAPTVVLTGMLCATGLLLLAGLIFGTRNSNPEAYARVYGTGEIGLARLLLNSLVILWPLGGPASMISVRGALTGLFLAIGLSRALRRWRTAALVPGLLLMLTLCLAGAVIYLPWSRFEPFYAIPFLVGSAGLFVVAAAGMMARPGIRSTVVVAAFLGLASPSILSAYRQSTVRAADRHVNWALADVLRTEHGPEVLVVAVPYLPDQAWQGRGQTLLRFSRTIAGGGRIEGAMDETCDQIRDRLAAPPSRPEVIVSYHHWCGALQGATQTIERVVYLPSLRPMDAGSGRVAADLLFRGF